MRRRIVLLLLFAQLAVLAYMAGGREYIRSYGQQVWLRTAPIDPRDPFRGEFVRLHYGLNSVASDALRGGVDKHREQKGYKVFAVLKGTDNDLYELDYLTDQRPQQGPYLKGRLTDDWRLRRGRGVGVKYGIEQYFVEQGQGRRIEKRRGGRDSLQVPMEVLVAVGGDGTAVVKDFRWSRLGIQLEILRFNRRGPDGKPQHPDQPLSPRLRLTLKNVSAEPLLLFDSPDQCQLRLLPVEQALHPYRPVDKQCDDLAVDKSLLRRLEPDKSRTIEIELSDSRWLIDHDGEPKEIGALPVTAMFRLQYRAPSGQQLVRLEEPERRLLWRGTLPSRAFNVSGRID